jgi:hypothetical protein
LEEGIHMKSNLLIVITIICGIIALFGIITYQWFLVCGIIALFILILLVWYVTEKLIAIQQSVEKIEQHLEAMRKPKL